MTKPDAVFLSKTQSTRRGIFWAVSAFLAVIWLGAPAMAQGSDRTVPPLGAFERFDRLVTGDTLDLTAMEGLLAASDEPALRIELARLALEAEQPAVAVTLLLPLVDRLPAADPQRTLVLDLIAAAHRTLGNPPIALRAGMLAYDSALARLGAANPRLIERLDALVEYARTQRLAPLPAIAAERARLAALPVDPPAVRAVESPIAVEVWFGTNRTDLGGSDPATRFDTRAGPLTLGRLSVTIPPTHRTGMIERPSAWSLTGHADPMRHVVLAHVEALAREAFSQGCCGEDDRLLFIHGYNVSFHDGALRAAQLAFDLEFRGRAMYFSWPSRSTLLGYLADSNSVLASRPAMVEFLELATRGPGRLHVIAHSMGNRYLLEALDVFLRDHPDRQLGQVILGAPDVDREELAVRMQLLQRHAAGVTLYASRNDWALVVSRRIHGAPRAGDIGDDPVRIAGLATLDASEIPADTLGHSYFGDAPQILGDMVGLIRLGLPPRERCGTRLREEPVWVIRPDGCAVEIVRTASDLLERFGPEAITEARTRRDAAAGDDLDFWLGVLDVVGQQLSVARQ